MFWTLLKVRLQSVFAGASKGSKKNSTGMKVFVYILLGYAALCFIFMFVGLFSQLAGTIAGTDYEWLYFAIVAMMMVMLGFFTTVFAAQSQIFEAKDNELLLSMPVPVKYIVMTRISTLLVLDGIEDIVIGALAVFIFAAKSPLGAANIAVYIVELIGIMLLTSTLSTIFGWIMAAATSRMKNKAAFTTIISFVLMAAYFFVFSKGQSYLQFLLKNGSTIAASVKHSLYPFYCFGMSVMNITPVETLVFIALGVLPFALMVVILSRSFTKIATSKHGIKRKKYSSRNNKERSIIGTFTSKEIQRFFTNAAYMVNAGLGLIMMVIAAVFLVIKRGLIDSLIKEVPFVGEHIGIYAIFAMCMICMMNMVSAPSISLEGESLWIAKSMPVKPVTVLLAKVRAHIVLCTPITVILSLAVDFVIPMSLFMKAAVIVIPVAATVFIAYLGVVNNLVLPKLDWTDETVAIKQSMSVLLTMGIAFGIFITIGVAYGIVGMKLANADIIFTVILFVGFSIASLLMHRYLGHKGTVRFERL